MKDNNWKTCSSCKHFVYNHAGPMVCHAGFTQEQKEWWETYGEMTDSEKEGLDVSLPCFEGTEWILELKRLSSGFDKALKKLKEIEIKRK